MADQVVAPQDITKAGITPSYAGSLSATDTYVIDNNGRTFLHVKKSGAGACTVTVDVPGTIDGNAIADLTATVPATTGDKMIGPFPPGVYNQPGLNSIRVTFSEVTGLTLGVFRAG